MIQRLYIQEAAKQIGYCDTRSFLSWAKRFNLLVFRDNGCKKYYVLKQDFENTADRILLHQMERLSNDRSNIKVEYKGGTDVQQKNSYKTDSIGEHGQNLLSSLLRIIDSI